MPLDVAQIADFGSKQLRHVKAAIAVEFLSRDDGVVLEGRMIFADTLDERRQDRRQTDSPFRAETTCFVNEQIGLVWARLPFPEI